MPKIWVRPRDRKWMEEPYSNKWVMQMWATYEMAVVTWWIVVLEIHPGMFEDHNQPGSVSSASRDRENALGNRQMIWKVLKTMALTFLIFSCQRFLLRRCWTTSTHIYTSIDNLYFRQCFQHHQKLETPGTVMLPFVEHFINEWKEDLALNLQNRSRCDWWADCSEQENGWNKCPPYTVHVAPDRWGLEELPFYL